ncbi:hypothetical protein AAEP80_05795 [Curtobacterium sp. L3-7]|uniref:DUF7507 domain-containing protein n=1 Tax=Curtobacterium sp. L3-7 TaxID=3138787 RepID=UPI003B52ED5E
MRFHRPARLAAFALSAATLAAAVILPVLPAAAVEIITPGPLTKIETTNALRCQVWYQGTQQFYGSGSCYTAVAVDNVIRGYGAAWTPESQTVSGAGTKADPRVITTTVTGGGLRLTQQDSYVIGKGDFDTRVDVVDTTGRDRAVTVYRAADCYLRGGDTGYGEYDSATGAPSCLKNPPGSAEQGQVESFIPKTPGSNWAYGGYSAVYKYLSDRKPFPDRLLTTNLVDNGMGISWDATVPANGSKSFEWQNHFLTGEDPEVQLAASGALEDTNENGRTDAADTVTWTALLENTGNVPLSSAAVTNTLGASVTCPAGPIAVGATVTCTGSAPVGQSAIDAGSLTNTLSVSATSPKGKPAAAGPESATVELSGAAAVSASVTSNLGAAPVAGDTVTYQVDVENTGSLTVADLSVSTESARLVECTPTTIAPGGTAVCRLERQLTQADVDAGHLVFTGVVRGTPARGEAGTLADLRLDQDIASSATASVATTSDAGVSVQAGQTIRYTTTVTNTGTVTLSDLAARPAIGDAAACERTSLAPGASTTCVVTYSATQADVDAGAVEQTVTVVGAAPGADPVRLGSADVRDVAVPAPDVDASVETDAADVPAVGDVVTATVTVTNTGNVTLSDVTVDPATGDPVTCVAATLAPGATTTCVVTRAPLTQADIDSGAIAFSGDVLATTPAGARSVLGGVRVTDPVPATPSAAATMTSNAGSAKVGQTVTWTTTVTNTGNVTLSAVVVDTVDGAAVCDVDALAPGQRATCTSTAEVTQADVDSGTLDREAIVSAAAPGAAPAELARAESSDRIAPVPALGASTTSDVTEHTGVGDQVTWTTTVTNTGNVTLSALRIGAGTCDTAVLAPGAETRCVVSRELTQVDVDAGVVRLDEAISATTPAGATAVLARAAAEAPVAQHPALTATSSSDAEAQPSVGDVVTVVVAMENTGNVTLRDLALRPSRGEVADCASAPLAPGARIECTVTTTVTQADVDAGGFDVGTTVLGSTPAEDGVGLAETSVRADVPAQPAATLALAAAVRERLDPGAELQVEATVTNTGNVTLSDIELDASADQQVACPDGAIAPGASVTCTITVTVTQEHVDAGGIEFHVDGTAAVPSGARTAVPTADLTVPIDAEPGATLTLAVVPGGDLSVGSTIGFRATVANTGNVTLSRLAVSRLVAFAAKHGDAGEAHDAGVPACSDETVPVGGSVACTFERTITQSDLDSGSLRETVTASAGVPAGDDLAVAPASVTVTVPRAIEGSTELTANTDGPVSEGTRVTLTTTVRNTGSVTLSDLVVRQHDAGEQVCVATDLAPGAETTCSGERTVTAADVEHGALEAAVTVTATDPQGHGVDLPDASVKIPATAPAELAFTGVQGIRLTSAAALALLAVGAASMALMARRARAESESD